MSRNESVSRIELPTLAQAPQPLRARSIGSTCDCARHRPAVRVGATR